MRERNITMEQLPPKGVKREQAILELVKNEANGELLLQLLNLPINTLPCLNI